MLFILTNLPSYSTQTTYYVTPTPETPCPGEPCRTLSQYTELYFKNLGSNTTLVFLPGNHTLSHTIAIAVGTAATTWMTNTVINRSFNYSHPSLTLLGSPSYLPEVTSRIVCTWPAGFVFSSITELYISALAFISCGHEDGAAINIRSVRIFSIVNCTFQNNVNRPWQNGMEGGVIHTYNSTITLIGSTFQNNYGYCGGALFTTNSILTLINNVFRNNNGRLGGVVCVYSNSTLTLTANTFQNNMGSYGGAIYIRTNSTITFTGNTFQNNIAKNAGGALFVSTNCIITLTENTFNKNLAKNSVGGSGLGGALYVHGNSTITLTENRFQNNTAQTGGALFVYENSILILTKNTLHNNSANVAGGAINVDQNATLTLTMNILQNNSADGVGGALCVDRNSNITLIKNIFRNNLAEFGGALHIHQDSVLIFTQNIFQSNSANSGCAVGIFQNNTLTLTKNILLNNSVHGSGGALYIRNSNVTLTRNTFQINLAVFGGALYIHQDSTLILTKNDFQNNLASENGGALYINLYNTLIITKNTFKNNSVNGFGGALCLDKNSNITLTQNIFQINLAMLGGALYIYQDSTLIITENVFENNSAKLLGGTLYTLENNTLILTGNTYRNNLAGMAGGALLVDEGNIVILKKNEFHNNLANDTGAVLHVYKNNTLTFAENMFHNNSAIRAGGVICVQQNSTLTLTNNTFQDNSAAVGGALHLTFNNTLTLTGNTFRNNLAYSNAGGALSTTINNTLTLIKNTFLNNTARYGGAISIYSNTTVTLSDNLFQNNFAENGGVLYTHQSIINFTNNNFTNNTAEILGGIIFCVANSNLSMHGNHKLWSNTAEYGGGVAGLDCQITFAGNISFENNTATYGGGLYGDQLYVRHINGFAKFINNSAIKDGGGAYISRSAFNIEYRVTFLGNSALNGGGMMLTGDSKLYLQPNTHINFTGNFAKRKGGALMVQESNYLSFCAELLCDFIPAGVCFFQIQTQHKYDTGTPISEITELYNTRIHFRQNTALEAGATLYGSSIDNCDLRFINQRRQNNLMPYECSISGEVFNYITSNESLDISSDPLYICACEDGKTVCSSSTISMSVYPGGTISVSVIAYGHRNGTTPAVIHNITPNDNITFNDLENTQNITTTCTNLKYTVQSRAVETFQEIKLYAEGPCPPREGTLFSIPTNVLTIRLKILQCPSGFELSQTEPACICEQRLKKLTDECRIDDRTVKRDNELWVGYMDIGNSKGLILHFHCPFDYCSSNTMYIAVEDSDKQCSNNRSGLLCGKCSQNLSLAFGTSRCLQCSTNYFWLLAVFAVAGLALIFLLLALNLTVAAGTINGLIFYANVLAVNSATFFQPQTANILTVFIAWINLDLGIETCFYNGMDTYAKTWLQFVFPLYVWALVIGIISVSHYSIRISTILSNNTVAVLATLILLSYAKLLRTVIAALSYTLLEYPNNSQVAVWLYDGNIRYLSAKHIPLFIAALAFLIFLFIPYTLVLLFGQWIRKSKLKIFSPINNFRVFFFQEAYHAPYTDKHRYWTGLMLILRCYVFLVFAFNVFGDPSINLLCIGSATAVQLILSTLLGNRIYKNFFLNILELSFNSNLCIVAMATLYVRSAGGNQNAVTFTSIGVAFVTFVGIVIYHLVQQLKEAPRWWRRIRPSHSNNYNPVPQTTADSEPQATALPSPVDPSNAQFAVTYININDIVRAQLDESAYRDTNLL